MKIQCIRATRLAGYGIIRGGEILTVPDTFANDLRVSVNFKIVEGPKQKPTKGAKPPTDEDLKAKSIKNIIKLGMEYVKDALVNNGIQFDPKASDEKTAEIYYENFGFNTEPVTNEVAPE